MIFSIEFKELYTKTLVYSLNIDENIIKIYFFHLNKFKHINHYLKRTIPAREVKCRVCDKLLIYKVISMVMKHEYCYLHFKARFS